MQRVCHHFLWLQSSSINLWASSYQSTMTPTAAVSGTDRHFLAPLFNYKGLVQIFSFGGIPQSNTEHCCHAKIHLACYYCLCFPQAAEPSSH